MPTAAKITLTLLALLLLAPASAFADRWQVARSTPPVLLDTDPIGSDDPVLVRRAQADGSLGPDQQVAAACPDRGNVNARDITLDRSSGAVVVVRQCSSGSTAYVSPDAGATWTASVDLAGMPRAISSTNLQVAADNGVLYVFALVRATQTSVEARLGAYRLADGVRLFLDSSLNGARWDAGSISSLVPVPQGDDVLLQYRDRDATDRLLRRRASDGLYEPLAIPASSVVDWTLTADGQGRPVAGRVQGLCGQQQGLLFGFRPAEVEAGYIDGLALGELRSLGAPIAYGCGILNITPGATGTPTVQSVRENLRDQPGVEVCAPEFNSGTLDPASLCGAGNSTTVVAPVRALATLDLLTGALTHRPLPHLGLAGTAPADRTKEAVAESFGIAADRVFMRVVARTRNSAGGSSEQTLLRAPFLGAPQTAPTGTISYTDGRLSIALADADGDAAGAETQWSIEDGCQGSLTVCPQRAFQRKGETYEYRLNPGQTTRVRVATHDRNGGSRLLAADITVPPTPPAQPAPDADTPVAPGTGSTGTGTNPGAGTPDTGTGTGTGSGSGSGSSSTVATRRLKLSRPTARISLRRGRTITLNVRLSAPSARVTSARLCLRLPKGITLSSARIQGRPGALPISVRSGQRCLSLSSVPAGSSKVFVLRLRASKTASLGNRNLRITATAPGALTTRLTVKQRVRPRG